MRFQPSSFGAALVLSACGLLLILSAFGAVGQEIDRGALEQIFGEPVTTSATGKPQRASDVPADMVIITQDEIRRSGATNIPDILQFVTGIDVRRYTFGDAQVAVRGYDSPGNPRLLVLVDGRQVYDDTFGFESWSTIPVQLSEIRQIEIVKGPNSALFGFNAASGVINIVTFDPLLDNVNTATLRGGSQGYAQGEAVATQHFGSTAGVRLSAGGWTADGFQEPSALPAVPPRYASFNADGRWQATPWLLLRGSGGYTDVHTETALPVEETTEEANHNNYLRAGASAETEAGTIDLDLYRNELLGGGLDASEDLRTIVGKISDLTKLDSSNTVRFGVEYHNSSVTSSPPIYAGAISYDNYAANSMWDWQISPMFELTNAVRLDHLVLHQSGAILDTPGRTPEIYNNTSITAPSFNSGLVIHVSDLDVVRLTLARGLQLPSLVDFGAQELLAPYVYGLGSPRVQPEAVWNAELGYVRSLEPIKASLVTSVFFQRNTSMIGSSPYLPVGGIIATSAENFGSSNEIGFEVGLRGTTSNGFRWNGSYRFASITQDILSDVQPNQFAGFDNGTPVHALILGAGYTSGPWELDAMGKYQTGFTDYGRNGYGAIVPAPVPAYVTLNARVGYKVTDNLTIAGVAQQFNMSSLLEAAGSYVDRRFLVSVTVMY